MIQTAVVAKIKPMHTFLTIQDFIDKLDPSSISEERKAILQPLIDFIQDQQTAAKSIRLNFICTHNSRRSHLSQIWAQTMAYHLGINNTYCYSGGTEATAMYTMVAQTLKNTGFEVLELSTGNNPVYAVKYAPDEHPIICFSKKMDADFNPSAEFCAIMTCNSANEACPIVLGAAKRVPITYEDPKAFDNTPLQAEKYLERTTQIATEMLYIFSKVKA